MGGSWRERKKEGSKESEWREMKRVGGIGRKRKGPGKRGWEWEREEGLGGRGKGVGGRGREWEGNRLGKKEVGRRVRR